MILRQETVVPPVPQAEASPAERGSRGVGFLLVVVGTMLLTVATGDTLADFIEAKDDEQDYVECGSGNDVASVDLGDRVARNCETLYPG